MFRTNQTKGDTTFTKIYVAGLTWRTRSDDLRRHFERFGEVIDANVVCETYPAGRSKGYGFVTFRDAASTIRALENPEQVIDGRTANSNLASLRAKKNTNQQPNNNNGSFNQVIPPPYQYYHPQHSMYCPPVIWDPVSGLYGYMYNNPYYTYPTTQMSPYNIFDSTHMTQGNWHDQTNIRHVANHYNDDSIPLETIDETDQEAAPQKSSDDGTEESFNYRN